MTDQEIKHLVALLIGYRENTLSEVEMMELEGWISQNRQLFNELSGNEILEELKQDYQSRRRILAAAKKKIAEVSSFEQPGTVLSKRPVYQMNGPRWYAAAAVFLLIVSGITYLISRRHKSEPPQAIAAKADILPGGNKAVLTLSDGRHINLDSSTNGVVASQGTSKVSKLGNGQLAYATAGQSETAEKNLVFNSLTTPRAGQYSLVLPDGSRVWLNSASTLRYPVSFVGTAREVDLTGEAYFEIAKNPSKPFRVRILHPDSIRSAKADVIEVLGTSFNVNAYNDEKADRTTLIDGSIRVIHDGRGQVLQPAEQFLVDGSGDIQLQKGIDVDGVTAWKNGFFHFEKASVKDVMRQLTRWYDIEEVTYQQPVTSELFTGDIGRDLSLSKVISILGHQKVHISISARRITVLP